MQRTAAVILGGIAKPQETEQAQEPEAVAPEPQSQSESAPFVPQPAMAEAAQDVPF